MKFVALLLSFLITFNVMASSVSELERQIDDYQYSMTVEWDQKDQAFYNTRTDAFLKNLAKVIQEKSLTKEEVLALAEKKMNNSKTFEALKLKMLLLGKNVSSEELAQTLKDSAKDFYSTGASWNGDVVTYAVVGVFVLMIGYAIWFHATHECVEWESVYSCSTYDTCRSYSYDWDTGSEYCTWWDEETSCGYDDVCRQWQKKQ